jgi:hypothetical protein
MEEDYPLELEDFPSKEGILKRNLEWPRKKILIK